MTSAKNGDRDRPVQLDLFGEVAARLDAERADARRARVRQQLLATFQATKHRHPATGDDLGSRIWCGRCGAVENNDFLITINHEQGWCAGCYIRFRPGVLASAFGRLSERQRADRWDRQFFPDCAGCGHPWGLHAWDIGGGSHDTNAGCHALLRRSCRCSGYTLGALPAMPHGHGVAAHATR